MGEDGLTVGFLVGKVGATVGEKVGSIVGTLVANEQQVYAFAVGTVGEYVNPQVYKLAGVDRGAGHPLGLVPTPITLSTRGPLYMQKPVGHIVS